MKLYELSTDFSRLFDDFDAICSYEPEKSESGDYIDDGGSIIEDLAAYRQELQEAWFDTLDGIEQEFEDKAENVAAYIKSLKAEADDLKEEEAALNRRRKVKENQIDRLKDYLLHSMMTINRTKIDTPKAKLSIRNNAESVQFDDEEQFIRLCLARGQDDYLRYKDPELNKTAVKKALQSGREIDGAHLIRTQSLIIK